MTFKRVFLVIAAFIATSLFGFSVYYGYEKIQSDLSEMRRATVRSKQIIEDSKKPGFEFAPANTPSPFDATGRWEFLGGQGVNDSWEVDRFTKVRALAIYKGDLFAGLGGRNAGDGQVWKFDGNAWSQIAGDGISNSWPSGLLRRVNVLLIDGQYLYAGVGTPHKPGSAAVWRFDGVSWKMIGGDGQADSWPEAIFEIAYTLTIFRDELYVGMTSEDQPDAAAVYKFDGTKWSRSAGGGELGSWDQEQGYYGVYELLPYQGELYAGTWGRKLGTGTVWRFARGQWAQVGGNGALGSWSDWEVKWVEALAVFEGKLLVSLQRPHPNLGSVSSVWLFDGRQWSPVAKKAIPALWQRSYIFNHLIGYEDRLYVATGGFPGSASVWELTSESYWRHVAGQGLYGSWGADGPVARQFAGQAEWVYRMAVFDDDLVVGLAGYPGAAQVWRYSTKVQGNNPIR